VKYLIIIILTSSALFAQTDSLSSEKREFGKNWSRLMDNYWEINLNLDSVKIGDTLTLSQAVTTNLNTYRFVGHSSVQFVASIDKRPKWKQKAYWFPFFNYLDINSYPFNPRKTTKFKLINDTGDKINFICTEIIK
jgi:hypothetical protein